MQPYISKLGMTALMLTDDVTEGGRGGWGASAGEFWHTEELKDGVNVNEFAEGTIYGRLFIYPGT